MQFIDLRSQYLRYKPEIDASINRVLEHGQFIMGPEVGELEEALTSYVGIEHCITVASGTDSLEIALRALNIGPGDEVITVPFTWISSAEVISQVGAKPVFVDIDIGTYNIDLTQIEMAITPRTRAIIAVSLFGQMPDYDAINKIAERHGVIVIEDAAQSFGATQNGRKSCSLTRISSTSFFPSKPFGCYGDGGALFTADPRLAEAMRAIRSHGGIRRHHHTLVGMNGRLDTIQAAILLAKLPHFENEVKLRTSIGARYSSAIANYCVVPQISKGNTHVYAQYTVRVPERDLLAERLKANGIPTAVYYPKCLHEQPVYKHLNYNWGAFPNSERTSREVISLPMGPFLTELEQDKVIKAFIKCI
jgi:UDP-2-acetamido-2-deoxy-ribo-hexuluronate aminotransferase